MVNRTPMETNNLDERQKYCRLSCVHCTLVNVRIIIGQQRYKSYVKFTRNTVMPVSFDNILIPPKTMLSQACLQFELHFDGRWKFFVNVYHVEKTK